MNKETKTIIVTWTRKILPILSLLYVILSSITTSAAARTNRNDIRWKSAYCSYNDLPYPFPQSRKRTHEKWTKFAPHFILSQMYHGRYFNDSGNMNFINESCKKSQIVPPPNCGQTKVFCLCIRAGHRAFLRYDSVDLYRRNSLPNTDTYQYQENRDKFSWISHR